MQFSEGTFYESDGISEEILSSDAVYRGNFLQLDDVTLRLPNGSIAHHDVIRHPGAVAIIALRDDKIILVRQYRTALERITLEIPAGKLERGEDLESCARRELEEETGFQAGSLEYLLPVAVAAGYSDEVIHLFRATDLHFVAAHPDDDEFVAVEMIPVSEFIAACQAGKIEDSKTLLAALFV